jgi:hypothetical protein
VKYRNPTPCTRPPMTYRRATIMRQKIAGLSYRGIDTCRPWRYFGIA